MFNPDYYYHILNRGVDKRKVFLNETDYRRFLLSLNLFNSTEPIFSIRDKLKSLEEEIRSSVLLNQPGVQPLARILAYCLLPNHFHLMLQELVEGGISELMKRMGGYTSYFNLKYERSGSLFQGKYKHIEIDNDFSAIKVLLYINGNPEIHSISDAYKWQWSSNQIYLSEDTNSIVETKQMHELFNSISDYKKNLSRIIQECKDIKDNINNYYME